MIIDCSYGWKVYIINWPQSLAWQLFVDRNLPLSTGPVASASSTRLKRTPWNSLQHIRLGISHVADRLVGCRRRPEA